MSAWRAILRIHWYIETNRGAAMKRLLWAAVLCLPMLAGAQGHSVPPYPGAYDEEGPSLEQIHSIPYSYVGGSGRISLTFDDEGNSTGELLRIFDNTGEHAYIGQLWWGHGGAGGVQFGYNWLWGGMTLSQARENPERVAVARTLLAIDQNPFKDRKLTLGFGIERPSYFIDAYLSAAASGSRDGGARSLALENLLSGMDEVGSYTQLETTTTLEEFATAAYDYGIGLRVGHSSNRRALRVYGGLDYQRGDAGAHVFTVSAGADKHLGRRGWSLSGLVEHDQSSTDPLLGTSSDTRATLSLRYEFGGRIFVPTSELVAPAWIARALVNAPSSRPRVVQTYTRRTGTTTTTELAPKQYTNHHPVGVDDMVSLVEGSDAIWIDVLANDSDADGDALSLVSVTPPLHGTASISDNRVRYTPAAGFTGGDTFSYTLSDGRGGSGGANVHITVTSRPNQAPIARDDSAVTPFQTPITLSPLSNDTDPDGDDLTLVAITQPVHGNAVLNGDGQVTYTPDAGFSGADGFSYTIEDGRGGSASAQVAITVMPPLNSPPVAVNDSASVAFNGSVDIDVLANDSDPDGDPLTLVSVTQGNVGTVSVLGNGMVRYSWDVPGQGTGMDQFTYTISDGRGGTATAIVFVTLVAPANTAPVAVNDSASAAYNTSVQIDVLANDSDPDGDPLEVISVTQGTYGSVTILANGNVSYFWMVMVTPGVTDQFTYTISDGNGGTATATVFVTLVAPANNPPVAANDSASVALGDSVDIDVLANDSDPDSDPLTVISVTPGVYGSTTILPNGSVRYSWNLPLPGGGTDQFTYTVGDGNGGTATATVFVTQLNRPPVAVDDTDTLPPAGAPTVLDVLDNDHDPDGDGLTIIQVGGTPLYGNVQISSDNLTLIYTRMATFPPSDDEVFTYTISDGRGGTATATVTLFP